MSHYPRQRWTTPDWPRAWGPSLIHVIGDREFACSVRLDLEQPLIAIVSSLVPSHQENTAAWNQTVESMLHAIERDQGMLLVAPQAAIGERILHVAKRLKIRYLRLQVCESWSEFETASNKLSSHGQRSFQVRGMRRQKERVSAPEDGDRFDPVLYVSPPSLPSSSLESTIPKASPMIPVVDLLLTRLADKVFSLFLRPGGRTTSAIQGRLLCEDYQVGTTICALGDWLPKQGHKVAHQLLDQGAVGWWSSTNQVSQEFRWLRYLKSRAPATLVPIMGLERWWSQQTEACCWLSHCTRSRIGPWPDQTSMQYADEMMLEPLPHAGPWLTLARILQQRRLRATSWLRKGQIATLSFSARPLPELLAARTYRPHLGRWDWEPYGVSIRRACAERLLARPVLYGTRDDYLQLQDQDKPYFQVVRGERSQIDWQIEQEWRLLGDLRLHEVPADEGVVFVPTLTEARMLARLSPFVVVSLESPD